MGELADDTVFWARADPEFLKVLTEMNLTPVPEEWKTYYLIWRAGFRHGESRQDLFRWEDMGR